MNQIFQNKIDDKPYESEILFKSASGLKPFEADINSDTQSAEFEELDLNTKLAIRAIKTPREVLDKKTELMRNDTTRAIVEWSELLGSKMGSADEILKNGMSFDVSDFIEHRRETSSEFFSDDTSFLARETEVVKHIIGFSNWDDAEIVRTLKGYELQVDWSEKPEALSRLDESLLLERVNDPKNFQRLLDISQALMKPIDALDKDTSKSEHAERSASAKEETEKPKSVEVNHKAGITGEWDEIKGWTQVSAVCGTVSYLAFKLSGLLFKTGHPIIGVGVGTVALCAAGLSFISAQATWQNIKLWARDS